MTISKHTLPKRIISLLLAVAIMVGFVPIIDIDLTAFAAPTTKITLTDDAPQSGDNWVWDNTTQTLSLYNAIFSAGDSGAVIEYTGAETLKIKQIGCNTIKFTGSSADTFGAVKAEKIEVIGSGILYILGYNALFDADSLKISNGYIYSNDAAALNKRDGNKTTVSNCVLDLPNTEIVAKAQSDDTAGFIMKSGYVYCNKLTTKYNASNYLAAEIEGGYLNVNTIGGEKNGSDYAYIKLGQAVVMANTLVANAAFKKEADSTILSDLHKSTLLFISDNSGIYYDTKFSGSKEICGSFSAYYDDTLTDRAVYYDNEMRLTAANFPTDAGTIVCDDTLDLTAVSDIPAGMTIYGHTLLCSGTINGCLIGGGEVRLGSADSESTVSSTGRIYGSAFLSLENNATISEGSAVTVKETCDPIYLDGNQLTINGDLTAYIDAAAAIFGSDDENLVIGENAQIAAMSTGAAVFDAEQSFNTISGKAKNAGRIVYGMDSNSNDKLLFPANYNDNVIYIGSGFDAQLNCTAFHNKFYYNLKNSYDAWYTLECTRPFAEDYNDLTVTITNPSTGENVTSHFGIIKNSAGRSNEVKVQIRNNDLDVASGDTFAVTFSKDGCDLQEYLVAVTPDFTLDFTQPYDPTSPTQWSYCGYFYETNIQCSSATVGDKKIWAWYPNGTEGYTGKVLVLDGLVFDTTANNAITVPGDTTIVVKGDNKIQSKFGAIRCEGSINVIGDDASTSKLTLKSNYSSEDHYTAIGPYGNITIKNFKNLVVEMGEATNSSWGASSGNSASGKKSYGIYGRTVTIENVTGRITAGNANESAAIAASSAINISNCDLTLSAYNYAIKAPTVTTATLSVLDNAYADDTLSTAITLADYNSTASNGIVTNTDYKIYTDIATATRLKTKSIYTVAVEETGGSGTIALGYYGGTGIGTGTGPANVTYSTTDKKFQADERAWFETTVTAPAGGYYIKKLSITDGSDTYALIDNSEVQTLTTPRSVSIQGQPTINSTTGKITSAKLKFSDISSDKTLTVEYSNAYMVTYDILAPSGTVDFGTTDIANPIAAGTRIEATAHPNADYELDTVKVNGTPITPNGNNFSFSVAEQDTNVEIRFKKITYTVTANTPANGNVTFDKDITAPIETGTTITATAAPDNGYKISSVKVNGTAVTPDANGKFSFTVTQNTTVEVTFSNIIHTVTANTPANGTVSFSPSIDNGVAHGATVTATAAPDSGYKISSVKVNGNSVQFSNNSFSFTVTQNTTVEVTFSNIIHTISYGTSSNGTLTFEPDISNGVAHGTTVTATATPDNGCKISSVRVNGTAVTPDANGKFSFTVNAHTLVEVSFTRQTYNVTLTTQPQNGTLTFEPDISNGVAHGATVTATATPNSGYKISSVKVNGTAVTPDANGKFSFTVTGNTTVEVTFARKQSSTGGSTGGIIHGSDILPRLDGKGYNYTRMAEVLATYPKGSTATIEVNGNYDIPLAVIKAIKDGGLKVKIITSYISSRYIDGEEIKTPEAINVSFIKTHKFEAIELSGEEGMQFTVKNIFIPADLTVILGSKNAGMFANLYKRVGDEFIFEACAKIGDDGSAAFKDCTDGGNYVIMLSEYSALPGDVNNDGKITAADASALLQYLVGLDSDKRKNLIMADFNGDEEITARDASLILKFLVKN